MDFLSPQEKAISLINKCFEDKTEELDLSALGISQLPVEICDLVHLKSLDCSLNNLVEPTGIETLTNLTSLNCCINNLDELTGLENLTNLTSLDCSFNKLNELTGIENLINLTSLNCRDCELNTLTGVENLTKLTILGCDSNKLVKLTGIENLTNLTSLDCSFNKLNELTGIENLINLTSLNCRGCELNTLTGVENLTKLTILDCDSNKLVKLTGIENLTNLTSLDCSFNNLVELTGIENLTNLTSLDCSFNNLEELTGIENLTNLTFLGCSFNNLSEFTGIGGLTNLTILVFGYNNFNETGIENLTNLTSLDCSGSQLNTLNGIENLIKLTKLDCHNNKLENLSGIENLIDLTSLNCSGNLLTNIDEIEKLDNLTFLNCSRNFISSLNNIVNHPTVDTLYCINSNIEYLEGPLPKRNNPIKFVPYELLDNINAIRSWSNEIEQYGYVNEYKEKIIFVGNGRVGKTTLAKALKERKPQNSKYREDTTIGISLLDWSPSDVEGNKWEINIWDFGGQKLYHSTHRLFQSLSGIYCVLWAEQCHEGEKINNHTLRYWLDLIHNNESDNSIITIKSQIDLADKVGLNNEAFNDQPYSCLPRVGVSAWDYTNIETLRSLIISHLNKQAKLQIRIPKTWDIVREEVKGWGKTISKSEFEWLCSENNVLRPSILLTYLNRCGDIFYDEYQFSNTIFIDQNWVLEAINRLFEVNMELGNPRDWIKRNNGEVSGAELYEIFHDYEPQDTELFVSFMIQAQMLFCLSEDLLTKFKSKQFVVPSLLTDEEPLAVPRNVNADVHYRLHYPWLHRLVIESIIVECHHLSNESYWWLDGIYIAISEKVQCRIAANTDDSTLTLSFWGRTQDIKSALPQVIKSIEATKVASPISEELCIKGKGWCPIESIKQFALLSEYIVDIDGQKHNGMLYYAMLDIDCEAVNELKPVQNFFMIGGTFMSRNITNSPGAIAGDITNSSININIGSTQDEIHSQIDEIKSLKAELAKAELVEKEKYIRQLDTVEDELNEGKPDTDYIGKTLAKFSGILDNFEEGNSLYLRAVALLSAFGIVIV
ncbi:leucine-rich repeat domain-containing protein [Pseudoalteromonas sp. MMG006]|uniref:leucine-rich repeat domain-containing protein n=1 Tax=Pseudoalteromonas sp. MMG006 TaxID=2822683 RepID=UPI001B366521|nr:leucine-rich repeat domain-containing protein [Pseudoalteromonas sp. MMG006]MBQ4801140.1 leucine-rich repeat domain-containing protein [Pseudoalteromonas sp. MMG006]